MPHHLGRQGIIVFLVALVFIAFYWVGLPSDFNADQLSIGLRGTNDSTYSALLLRIADPRTPAWFYPPAGLMEYLRPLQLFWMKIYFDLFNSSLIPFHITSAIGYGLFCFVIFTLIASWTRRALYGWIAVLLYLSFPSNFYTLTSTFSGDFQQYLSVLCITALLAFCRLTFGSLSRLRFLGYAVLWLICVWLAIKLKSSEKILPFVCGAFLVWRIPFIRFRLSWKRISFILALLAFSMILVVPFKSIIPQEVIQNSPRAADIQERSNIKDRTAIGFQIKNLVQRTFYVPGGDIPFIKPFRKKEPKSFTENYGFFLGWFFWISILLVPFLIFRKPPVPSDEKSDGFFSHAYWMAMIWFAAMIAGFASKASVYDVRFLNFAYVPSLFILGGSARIWEERFFATQTKSLIFRGLLGLAVIITVILNLNMYTKLVAHFGAMQNFVVQSSQDIYQDVYGTEPHGWELYQKHQELESRYMVIDWYNLPDTWYNNAMQQLEDNGRIYFLSRTKDSERLEQLRQAGLEPVLWQEYDFVKAKPVIFRLFEALKFLKKKFTGRSKERKIFVYRIVSPEATLASS